MIIEGDGIRLRPMQKSDIELKVKWYNDPVVNKTIIIEEPLELEKSLKWFDSIASDDNRRDFVIETVDGEPIGITGLLGINRKLEYAECFCVIGEKSFWGKGIGTLDHSLLLQYAFEKLGLNKIWAVIYTDNAAIFKIVEKLGFKIEGTLREEKTIDGKKIDLYRIGALKREFTPTHKTCNFIPDDQ
jgi:RimJ/RimL family protein N-acetyltransferase